MPRGRDPDFIYAEKSARPRSGFYLHKEMRSAEIRIFPTQRISARPRSDFLYPKNFIRKSMQIQGCICKKIYFVKKCIRKRVTDKWDTRKKSFRAARAHVYKTVVRKGMKIVLVSFSLCLSRNMKTPRLFS